MGAVEPWRRQRAAALCKTAQISVLLQTNVFRIGLALAPDPEIEGFSLQGTCTIFGSGFGIGPIPGILNCSGSRVQALHQCSPFKLQVKMDDMPDRLTDSYVLQLCLFPESELSQKSQCHQLNLLRVRTSRTVAFRPKVQVTGDRGDGDGAIFGPK
ncbi:hypothetical protein B0H10DRAFT_1954834 [Mycena sp. CBHHK59/15]|nr:hypothetical protein B0H10DRAFT_1954834 [Mycena sp. CBHHK59/15]